MPGDAKAIGSGLAGGAIAAALLETLFCRYSHSRRLGKCSTVP